MAHSCYRRASAQSPPGLLTVTKGSWDPPVQSYGIFTHHDRTSPVRFRGTEGRKKKGRLLYLRISVFLQSKQEGMLPWRTWREIWPHGAASCMTRLQTLLCRVHGQWVEVEHPLPGTSLCLSVSPVLEALCTPVFSSRSSGKRIPKVILVKTVSTWGFFFPL